MQSDRRLILAQAQIFKALGHPSRLLMMDSLRAGERCVCDLQKLVGVDISTVSNHLAVLRAAGLVATRREGRSVFYKLSLCCLDAFLGCTSIHVQNRIDADHSMLQMM